MNLSKTIRHENHNRKPIPVKDSLYNSNLEAAHLKEIATVKMQHLEKQRMEFLSPDFNPQNNWWGSSPTID